MSIWFFQTRDIFAYSMNDSRSLKKKIPAHIFTVVWVNESDRIYLLDPTLIQFFAVDDPSLEVAHHFRQMLFNGQTRRPLLQLLRQGFIGLNEDIFSTYAAVLSGDQGISRIFNIRYCIDHQIGLTGCQARERRELAQKHFGDMMQEDVFSADEITLTVNQALDSLEVNHLQTYQLQTEEFSREALCCFLLTCNIVIKAMVLLGQKEKVPNSKSETLQPEPDPPLAENPKWSGNLTIIRTILGEAEGQIQNTNDPNSKQTAPSRASRFEHSHLELLDLFSVSDFVFCVLIPLPLLGQIKERSRVYSIDHMLFIRGHWAKERGAIWRLKWFCRINRVPKSIYDDYRPGIIDHVLKKAQERSSFHFVIAGAVLGDCIYEQVREIIDRLKEGRLASQVAITLPLSAITSTLWPFCHLKERMPDLLAEYSTDSLLKISRQESWAFDWPIGIKDGKGAVGVIIQKNGKTLRLINSDEPKKVVLNLLTDQEALKKFMCGQKKRKRNPYCLTQPQTYDRIRRECGGHIENSSIEMILGPIEERWDVFRPIDFYRGHSFTNLWQRICGALGIILIWVPVILSMPSCAIILCSVLLPFDFMFFITLFSLSVLFTYLGIRGARMIALPTVDNMNKMIENPKWRFFAQILAVPAVVMHISYNCLLNFSRLLGLLRLPPLVLTQTYRILKARKLWRVMANAREYFSGISLLNGFLFDFPQFLRDP